MHRLFVIRNCFPANQPASAVPSPVSGTATSAPPFTGKELFDLPVLDWYRQYDYGRGSAPSLAKGFRAALDQFGKAGDMKH
ncbi:hypothetical protein [Spirosoma aerophilum]